MAEKTGQFLSHTIAGIRVDRRPCGVTSRALEVYRDKVLVSWLYERREDKSWYSQPDSQSHTHWAHPHTHFHADKTLTTLVQWCVTARMQPPVRQHGC